MKKITWKIKEIAAIANKRVKIRKDMIICITGPRGEGKSTCGFHIAKELKMGFRPKKDIIFSLKKFKEWFKDNIKKAMMFDEAISMHNRDFFDKLQKEIIKILNMYRDSFNIIILCIPNFDNLDKQVRQLVRMRIHITKRGHGVLLLPKNSAHNQDIWDSANNGKIEYYALKKKKAIPWHKFSTFAGYIKFKDLSPKQKEVYLLVKKENRNEIFFEYTDENSEDPMQKIYTLIVEGKMSMPGLKAIALSQGVKYNTLRRRIERMLQDNGMETKLTKYLQVLS